MATKILVPEMGESVLEATVAHWLKKEGEFVNAGEVLVELETDKVNLEVGAKVPGTLASIDVAEGADVRVGDVLGIIDEKAEKPASKPASRAPERQEMVQASLEKPGDDRGNGKSVGKPGIPQVSPVAYRLARENNVDIEQVHGTGPDGRISKADVEQFMR